MLFVKSYGQFTETLQLYKTNWLGRTLHGNEDEVVGKDFVKAYIDFYNEGAANSGLINLPVGLLKTGEGILTLSGNNTYQGASIAKQGTLSIDGSVAGDAYSIEKGTIAGRGTIHGTLYNQNIAIAGDASGSGHLTVDKLISRGVLLSQYQNGTNTQFIVSGKGSKQTMSWIYTKSEFNSVFVGFFDENSIAMLI